jgi:hypothetical protein
LANMLTLFCGAVRTPGRRSVTTALTVLGLTDGNFSKFHHVFSRARWSPMCLSRLLLDLLIRRFLAAGEPMVILGDEHLERRKARQIAYRGLWRDPVRSTKRHRQSSWGIRWLCLALLVRVPWSSRRWALPFLVYPLLSEHLCERLGRPHRTVVDVTGELLRHLRRWQPDRPCIFVGDNTYAAVPLANRCRQGTHPVVLVSRLRLDAVLHDYPAPRPPGKRGATPKKGRRVPSLAQRLADPATVWVRCPVCWYGQPRELEVATGDCLWYRGGQDPVPLRWVLVRSTADDPHPITPGAVFCTDRAATPEQILAWFVGRWNIEVTFAEIRTHLGFETQRHWAPRSVNRITPCLFGVFSLVVVLAKALHPEELPVPQQAWYRKEEATFADALAAVRRYLWSVLIPLPVGNCVTSPPREDVRLIPAPLWERLQHLACYAP